MKKMTVGIQIAALLLITGIMLFLSPSGLSAVCVTVAGMLMVALIGYFSAAGQQKQMRDQAYRLVRELNAASGRISSVSQEISLTIDENEVSSGELFSKTGEMNALILDVGRNLNDMIAQIKEMIRCSDESRSVSLDMEQTGNISYNAVQSGMKEILHIVDTMKEVKGTSNRACSSIERLKSASGDVQAIVEKISDISKQMHIITVNASVEASRAGQYGRSFAVVAKEFQTLTGVTDRSLQDIGTLIETIKDGIDQVYNDVVANSGNVDEGVRYTQVVENNLNQISASFTGILNMVDRISVISEAQSRLAGTMGNSINDIEQLIGQASDDVGGVFESARRQKRGIENISDMESRLKKASDELSAIAESSTGQEKEALDEKTRQACGSYFPLVERELCRNPILATGEPERHEAVLRRFKEANPLMEAVWTNESNGRFIYSIPAAGIANAAARDWFRAAIQGEKYISSIYISGITKNRCVTLSLPFYDQNGSIGGVVGVDLNLEMLRSRR